MKETGTAARLLQLYEQIQNDPGYRNERMGKVFVPGRGAVENGGIVLVGEAPGREEEKDQSPFVGPAGQNLDALLQRIRLLRSEVFITNLVKYRPCTPEGLNRKPSAGESRVALPYLLKELEVLSPILIVSLGLSSAKAILQRPQLKMNEANGVICRWNGLSVLVTYHPSPFNYNTPTKREALYTAFSRLREIVHQES